MHWHRKLLSTKSMYLAHLVILQSPYFTHILQFWRTLYCDSNIWPLLWFSVHLLNESQGLISRLLAVRQMLIQTPSTAISMELSAASNIRMSSISFADHALNEIQGLISLASVISMELSATSIIRINLDKSGKRSHSAISRTTLYILGNWAASWQNQQSDCAPSEDLDQPGYLPSLMGVFAVRMKKAWVPSYPLSAQRRLCSDWADAQTDLSLR